MHIPFCVKKCLYCDFVSSTRLDLAEDYLRVLLEDIERSGYLGNRVVRTVYFGGGTPSLVPTSFIEKVLMKIEELSSGFEPIEITIELNPESTDPVKVKDYTRFGMNRASLGVQAFDDRVLTSSGRPHGTDEVVRAATVLRENFKNLNFDFIIGLPGYDAGVVESNLKLVEEFEPEHVSVYMLELDEGTTLYELVRKGKISLPDEAGNLFDLLVSGLEGMGYGRYELSNFSKPGFESIHNKAYWLNLDYAGFGLSAGGHVGRFRYVRTLSLNEYMENPLKNSYERENDDLEELSETLFMNLRLSEGVDIERMKERFGWLFLDFLNRVKDSEYFEVSDGKLKLSKKGFDFSKIALEEVVSWKDGLLGEVSGRS